MAGMRILKTLLVSGAGPVVMLHVRLMIRLKRRGWRRMARFVSHRIQRKYGVFVSARADLHEDLHLPHPTGIVVGDGVKLGPRVTIYQNVTLGGARVGDGARDNYPVVGEGAVLYAGCVVVGKINIGRDCVVGANAVVTRDVPDGATVVGIPARIVGSSEPACEPLVQKAGA